jgi:outer membrane protein insertion porin family/translocation and assembly module TamA
VSLRRIAAVLLLGATGCSSIPPGRTAVDDVRIQGTKVIDPDALGEKLATAPSSKFLGLFRGVVYDYEIYDPSVLQRDLARIERYCRGHGFFEAHARAGRVEALSADHVRVEIVVEEGPPTVNRAIRVDGVDGLPKEVADAARQAARDALGDGWRFNEDDYAAAKTKVKRSLTDHGYAWADVTSDAAIDVGARAVDYVFVATPGPLARFGEVTIAGLDPTGPRKQEIDEAPLRRSIAIAPGDPYSTEAIDEATRALLDLEVFSAVDVVPSLPQPPPADPVVPIAVRVEPKRLREVQAGFGAELDSLKTEVHLRGRWEDHNFLGDLRTLSIDLKPGLVFFPTRLPDLEAPRKALLEGRLKLSLRQPAFLEQRTSGFIQPELNVFPLLVPGLPDDGPVIGYFEVKNAIGVDRPFGTHVVVSLAYNFQTEIPFVDFGTDALQAQPHTLILSYPDLLVKVDFTDGIRHHEGFFLQNDLSIAGGPFGGVAADVREQPTANVFVPISRRVTLAVHTSVGFLFPANYGGTISELGTPGAEASANDVQISYFRGFFGGGPASNRGFPLRGIAPHGVVTFLTPQTLANLIATQCVPGSKDFDAARCELPIGGFTLWETSVEARIVISGPFSTAIFCDAGDVSPKIASLRFDRPHVSCGGGFRYDTGVVPLRLDIGYRVPPLQVLGYSDESAVLRHDPTEGTQPRFFGQPIAVAFGVGEAF